jgi:GT2 family glycosyltransferase
MSGTVYTWAEPNRVWYAGGRFDPIRGGCRHLFDVPASSTPVPTEYLPSCALLISPEVLAALGGLAECYYPFYFEDTEYAWRAGVAGFARVYAPRAAIYHKIGTSHWPPIRNRFLYARHNGFWIRRNLQGLQRAAALGYLAINGLSRALVRLLKGQPAMASAIARGTWSGLFDPLNRPKWPEPLPGISRDSFPSIRSNQRH